MRLECAKCSFSFTIDEASLVGIRQLFCPQCNQPIMLPLKSEEPKTAPAVMNTSRMGAIKLDQFGELSLPENKKISLTVFSGSQSGSQRYEITSPLTRIGRKIGDILIDHPSLSPQHAALEIYDEVYIIRDLNSKQGTFVNKVKVSSQRLYSTDEIRLGKCSLLFLVTELDYLSAEPPSEPDHTAADQEAVTDSQASRGPEETTDTSRVSVAQTRPEAQQFAPGLEQVYDARSTIVSSSIKPTGQSPGAVGLRFITGPLAGQTVTLRKSLIVLGRGDQADMNLDDQQVSRKHAAIELVTYKTAYLKDLSSANGTYLNGALISSSRLLNGDTVRIGSSEIEVQLLPG
ncbi:FHA domain-containing protein [bacterium]|nr:FHA domain-containing protein [bacterium]